jgi:hypothetical protein
MSYRYQLSPLSRRRLKIEYLTPFLSVPLRYMSYSAVILLTFIAFFMLLRDGYENNSVTDRIKETSNKSAYTVSEKNETNASIGWENNRSLFPTTIYPIPPSQQQ